MPPFSSEGRRLADGAVTATVTEEPTTRKGEQAGTTGHSYRAISSKDDAKLLNGDVGMEDKAGARHSYTDAQAAGNSRMVNGNVSKLPWD
jgi:hypothetical protein